MKKMSAKIVFFGNERIATGVTTTAPTLRALIAANYEVAAVVSNYTESTSRNGRRLEIKEVADEHDVPIWLPGKPADVLAELKALKPDAGVLVAYGKIVPQEIIDMFPHGIINIHPSLLPLHRGPIPIESVILHGEAETGVSLMRLSQAMDAGPVFATYRLALNGEESKQELADKLLYQGKELLVQSLPDILSGNLDPVPQDSTKATYDVRIEKQNGDIDWKKPAGQLAREIRSYLEWPKSRATFFGKEVIVTAAHVVKEDGSFGAIGSTHKMPGGLLGVTTSDALLVIDKLKPAGKPEMTGQAFLAGYGRSLK